VVFESMLNFLGNIEPYLIVTNIQKAFHSWYTGRRDHNAADIPIVPLSLQITLSGNFQKDE
jgi:hypothetical protein